VEAAEQPGRFRRVAPTGAALNWAILLVLVIVWGSTFAGIRMAVETIHPLWTVAGRMVSATIFLAFFLLISKTMSGKPRGDVQEEITPRAIFAYSFIGILFTATPFVLYSIAAQTTGSAVMAICNGGTPFVTTLAAHFLVKDRLTARRIAGVLMGFLGLAVLVWPEAQKGFGNSSLFGIILAIVGAALYAGGNVGTRMSPKLSPLMSSLILVGAGAAAATLAAFFLAPWPQEASVKSIIAVLMIGLFPTAIAMILYVWLIQRTGAVFVSFTTSLSPLWATGLGVIFLNEPLHWSMIGALALILAGVAVANARLRLSSAS
jgi:drug/metabolite transporter (DMT)-like permease